MGKDRIELNYSGVVEKRWSVRFSEDGGWFQIWDRRFLSPI